MFHNNKITAVVPCGGEAKRMAPLSHFVPKFCLTVLNKPLLAHTLTNLPTNEIKEIIFTSRDQRTEEQIEKIMENSFSHFPYQIIQQKPSSTLFSSLQQATGQVTTLYMIILLPDVFFYSNLQSRLKFAFSNIHKICPVIGVGIGKHDSEIHHTRITVSVDGKVIEINSQNSNGNQYRSGGIYILYRDHLSEYILKKQNTTLENKIEDLFRIMLEEGKNIHALFCGEFTNINTPKELLQVNLSVLEPK